MMDTSGKVSLSSQETRLRLIGIFKLVKGLLLLVVGVGTLTLLHQGAAEAARHWVSLLGLQRENRYFYNLLLELGSMDRHMIRVAGISTFIYAALLTTEGIGLSMLKRWAEYLTVVVTSSFIPPQIYGLARHFSIPKIIVIGLNVAVVWYLAVTLWGQHHGLPLDRVPPNRSPVE